MDTIPNEHDIPNGHDPEWKPFRMDTIPNTEWTRYPECTLTCKYSYLSFVYTCLVRTFYKVVLNKKRVFCVMLVSCKNKTACCLCFCLLFVFVKILNSLQAKLSYESLFLRYYVDAFNIFIVISHPSTACS